MNFIVDFQQGWLNISRMNCGVIKLVPEVKEPTNIGKFRLICLQNRGGKRWDVGRIGPFLYPFSYRQNKYECEYGYYQIRMRS
jgi:hypothetical protein